jgi:hypothetical protein
MNSSADVSLPSLDSTDMNDQCASSAQLVEIGNESLQRIAGGQSGSGQGDPR